MRKREEGGEGERDRGEEGERWGRGGEGEWEIGEGEEGERTERERWGRGRDEGEESRGIESRGRGRETGYGDGE
jgi:hypothetical protein